MEIESFYLLFQRMILQQVQVVLFKITELFERSDIDPPVGSHIDRTHNTRSRQWKQLPSASVIPEQSTVVAKVHHPAFILGNRPVFISGIIVKNRIVADNG